MFYNFPSPLLYLRTQEALRWLGQGLLILFIQQILGIRHCSKYLRSINEQSKNFTSVDAVFKGYEEPKPAFMFQFSERFVSAKVMFGMIDAAIMAVGDDYKKVDEALGILNGINYNINGGYQKDITLNGKEYLIEWVGDSINFMIIISK